MKRPLLAVAVLLAGCGGATTTITQPSLPPTARAQHVCKHYRLVVGPDGHRHRVPCSSPTPPAPVVPTTPVTGPNPTPLPGPQPSTCTPQTLGQTGCKVPAANTCHFRPGNLPDPVCTPGALNPAVTPQTVSATICVSGYTKTVRPPVSYTNPLKVRLMAAYGLTGPPSDYELDHLVPLTGGGAPASPENLWPQPYNPAPGAHQKDDEEVFLNSVACGASHGGTGSGQPDRLPDLQAAIAADWLTAYQADNPKHQTFGPRKPTVQ